MTYAVPAGDEHLRTYVRAVGGGKPRKLGDVGVVWSPNGKLVAVSDEKLLVVDPETGESRDLVRSDVINWRGFSFAPDGKALAYARADGRTGHEFEADVFVLRLSDGKTVQLTHDGHSDRPVWGGDWIAYRHFKFVNADHWPSIGEIRLVRSDGSGDRFFARGDEDTSMAHYGIEPVELSASGTRLLACYSHEFGCPPVAFTVPDGRRYELPIEVRNGVTALDLARDGTDVLAETGLHVGPYDVYSIPFEGGQARLLVKDAGGANWAR